MHTASAATKRGLNLIVFPTNLSRRSSLEIINLRELPQKKAVARKTTGRVDAFRLAQPLSVSTVRGRLGLSRKLFSRLAGFSERAIADWEGGKPVSEPGLRRIKELDRFRGRLSEIVAGDAIPGWLDAPNEAFDGLKP